MYANFEIQPIKLEDVVTAYVGKPHCCMCGCSGEYYYQKAMQEYAGKRRGYPVSDDEINDKKVLRVFNKVIKAQLAGITVTNIKDYIFTAIIGKTQYTLYLKET
jgi:hypothetical protein